MRAALTVAILLALVPVLAGCERTHSRMYSELVAERDRLVEEKRRLEEEFRAAIPKVMVPPEKVNPELGLVMVVPNSLMKDLLSRTLTEGIDGLSLRIANLPFHVAHPLKVRLLFLHPTLGDYELDVILLDVQGKVASGTPTVAVGEGRVSLHAPLKVVGGQGRARINLRWAGRGLAKPVCGTLDVAQEVEGTLAPLVLDFRGSAHFKVENSEFVMKPALPPQKFRLVVDPSQESWEKVEAFVREQKAPCRLALQKLQVMTKLRGLLANGFPVTIHTEKLKPIRLPVGVTERVSLEDRTLELTATPAFLELGRDRTWFGLDFEISRVDVPR